MSEQTLTGIMSQLVEGFTEYEVDLPPEMYKAIQEPLSRLEAAIESQQTGMVAAKKRFEVLEVLMGGRIDFTRTNIEELKGALEDPEYVANGWTIRLDIQPATTTGRPTIRQDDEEVRVTEAPAAAERLAVIPEVFTRMLLAYPRIILDHHLTQSDGGVQSLTAVQEYMSMRMRRGIPQTPRPTRTFAIRP